eukprot:TRINITY_DN8081_c0_g1_i4.p2 TRINITY_DN8081_c0_g1~~TRINITY_DN8081_c0_g1_i4.p2  ORF type:complete len:204 (+),score=19.69 TRINITY_DN8081_c0_g1_i4:325-936(+)
MAAGVNPVFLKTRDIPNFSGDRPATVLEMCIAAERTAGQGSIVGAQLIGGLWRIYPTTKDARSSLLVQGLRVRGTALQVNGTNPFVFSNNSGQEKLSTKVWIDGVPISVAESEIEHALTKAGCELRSSVKMDRVRDPDQKLTRFLTGRRFIFITVPTVPLEKIMKMNVFNARIYHKEHKLVKKTVTCSKCLSKWIEPETLTKN